MLQCPAMACWVDAYVGTGVFTGGGRGEEGGDSQLYDVTVLYYATVVQQPCLGGLGAGTREGAL